MHKMGKTFHRKTDGSIVVKDGAKIINNLPRRPQLFEGAPPAAKIPASDAKAGKPISKPSRIYDDEIAEIDDTLLVLRDALSEHPDAKIKVADLEGVTVEHAYDYDDEITLKEAIDLYRLEKAIYKEKRTLSEQEEDAKQGKVRILPYGDKPLGTASKEAFHEPNTKEWLLARTQGIGGSDKLGYVDENGDFVAYDSIEKKYYLNSILAEKSPNAIKKINETDFESIEERNQALPLRIGNRLERTIQYEFAKNNPEYSHYDDKNTRTADKRPWHRFNPDGVLQDNNTSEFGIFEAKTARDKETFEKSLPGYLAQCLHNASAANVNFAVLVADIDGEAEQFVYRVDYTPVQLQAYRDVVDRAWLLHKPRYDKKEARGETSPAKAK
jgi:hypothetical protein